jgi:hypothetical protein
MSEPPTDDLPVLGGVWVGPEPTPPAPTPPRPRPPQTRPVLIGGAALVLAGGTAGFLTGPNPLAPVLGVACGLALSGFAYLMLTRPPRQPSPPPPAAPASSPAVPMPVIYKPAPRPPTKSQQEADELEGQLMRLCHEDVKLFDRLVEYERSKHPRKSRRELIRLAIEHFWQDHR